MSTPFQHLYGHIRREDPRLYEALDRFSQLLLTATSAPAIVAGSNVNTVTQILSSASTVLTIGGAISGILAFFVKQDAVGNRLITWDAAKFEFAETDILPLSNTTSLFLFVANPLTQKFFQVFKVTGI